MFTQTRQTVLAALDVMIPACCAYGGGDRCDCKAGVKAGKWPTVHEAANGCPELRTIRLLVQTMTDDEWVLLGRRGGGVEVGALFGAGGFLAGALMRADVAVAQAQGHLDEAREALSPSADRSSQQRSNAAPSPGASPPLEQAQQSGGERP